MTQGNSPRFFYGYIVLAAAFAIMLVMWGVFFSFGIFFKPMLSDFGWDRAVLSGAFSLAFIVYGGVGIVAGRLTDRLGPRIVLTIFGSLFGLGLLLMPQVSAIWQLYLFYGVLVGVGMGGGLIPLIATISRWFVRRRGLIMGIAVSGIAVGMLILAPLANSLIATDGWRNSFTIVGLITLAVVIPAAQFLRRDPSQMRQLPYGVDEVEAENSNLQTEGFSFREAIHTQQFWMISAAFCSVFFAVQAAIVHVAPHAIELEISPANAAGIVAAIGGGNIASRIMGGGIADRIGNKLVLIISFILVSSSLFLLFGASELWMFYLFAVLFGLGHGGWTAILSPIVAELFGLRQHGTILGFSIFIGTIGGAAGPMLVGRIFDVTGSYHLAWLICGGVSTIAIILSSLLRPVSKETMIRI